MSTKGKEVATGSGGGKRKRSGGGEKSATEGGRKRLNREVLQFFEDAADVDEDEESESDFSDFDDEDEEFDVELKLKKEPPKTPTIPLIPKEEVIYEEEFDKMMEERYKDGSSFVRYAQDAYEAKIVERDSLLSSARDPTIWKVKCMVGREKHSAFCLMQKFVDLKSLGTKLQIISAFSVDHVKGFIFIEAYKQCDINEACKGLCSIYSSRLAPVPKNEVSHVLCVRSKSNVVCEGMWARVKNGKYKGDLAQIVAVNDLRKRATVKLIPRIDLQALAQKIGGGVSMKNAPTPAPKLISSSELEEFRPIIQYRRDRETGQFVEVLDGLMLKDGYLYKRVSVDSLSCWGVVPSEDELLKFQPSENVESDNTEWLKQLYGSPKKKRVSGNDKGGEKGESSSGSGMQNSFDLYDLVCFSRKDFGVIVGMEKDDHYKILKDGPDAPVVVSVARRDVKIGPSEMRFTALDHNKKIISLNDTVKVVEGPLKDRQGIVKQIYRGIIFMYDENETENGGYFCSKAQLCEKIKLSFEMDTDKAGGSGPFGFEDFPSSPKSPLSPRRPWQAKENNQDFSRGEKDGMFSVGQTLRIRVGPLKGYLCRVLAIRYSDVTVKLDSRQKVLTVKFEHLSELRGKTNSAVPASEDPGSSSFKPFNLLGTEGGSTGWTDGAGTSADGDRWNAGGNTTENNSWSSFPSSGLKPQSSGSAGDDVKEDAWEKKTSNPNSAWGAAATDDKVVDNNDQAHGWGKSEDAWNKTSTDIGSNSGASGGWGNATEPGGSSKDAGDGWAQAKLGAGSSAFDTAPAWDKGKNVAENPISSWGDVATGKNQQDSWASKEVLESGSWANNKSSSTGEDNWNKGGTGLNDQNQNKGDTWGSPAAIQGNSLGKSQDATGWGTNESGGQNRTDNWNKPKTFDADGGSPWGKQGASNTNDADGGSSWNKKEESSWRKQDGGSNQKDSSWGKQGAIKTFGADGGSSWNKKEESSWGKQQGGASWDKQQGGSSWGKQDGGSFNKEDEGQEFGGWSSKSFDGGRGSGGRRGRGGRGGRGQYGRGKSFGDGQFSGWNGGEGNTWTGDGASKNPPAWGNDQAGGWGKKPNSSSGDNESGWTKSQEADTEIGGSGGKWNSSKLPCETAKHSGWGAPKTSNSSSWDNRATDGHDNMPSGWGSKPESSGWKSNWNQKSDETLKDSEPKDQGDGWSGGKASGGGASKGREQTTSWKNESTDAGKNQDSEWGKKGNWNSGSGDTGGNASSSWGKKSNLNSVSNDLDGNPDSGWGKKGNWNSGTGDGGQDSSGWGKKSSWNQGSFAANGEDQSEISGDRSGSGGWRGGFGGRGGSDGGGFRGRGERGGYGGRNGSDRGGYGGRGRSDRGGFGGRGWSDRGDFGGRGGSDRGGFGGRGRSNRGGFGGRWRSDNGCDWNNNDSGEDRVSGWKSGANNDCGGWKSSGGGSWNQDKGQSQGWNSESGGTNNQAGGWSGQGSGWNQSGKSRDGEAGGGGGQNSGWNQPAKAGGSGAGDGPNGEAGQKSGWNESSGEGKISNDIGGGWKKEQDSGAQGGGLGSQGGWSKGGGSGDAEKSGDQINTWNQSSGGQSSGWNQSKDTSEGTNTGSGATDSWAKASSSNWGNKEDNGSSKGGWQ